jgi:metallophosphoesterase (TIGR00282 family)
VRIPWAHLWGVKDFFVNILFVADIVGKPGRRAVAGLIPNLIAQHHLKLCIANGENAAGGFGLTEGVVRELCKNGVDVITSGNHLWDKREILLLLDQESCLLRPANYPPQVPGRGSAVFQTPEGVSVGVLNLQGRVFMTSTDCPFRAADRELETLQELAKVIIVDMHAEATSEKIAVGWYLDGRVSAVIGTHTHVQTADECILPRGTAYITDAGMTGPHDSIIGIKKKPVLERFLTQLPTRFETATGDIKLCGVVVDVNEESGRARAIHRLKINFKGQNSG